MIKSAYSVSFLLSISIFVWQNVLYFPNEFRDDWCALEGQTVVLCVFRREHVFWDACTDESKRCARRILVVGCGPCVRTEIIQEAQVNIYDYSLMEYDTV